MDIIHDGYVLNIQDTDVSKLMTVLLIFIQILFLYFIIMNIVLGDR